MTIENNNSIFTQHPTKAMTVIYRFSIKNQMFNYSAKLQ